jgi:hypothetical protein
MWEPLVVSGVFPALAEAAGQRVPLRAALFATPGDDTPLWSDALGPLPVGDGGAVHLVLGLAAPLPATVFARFPRWLSVSREGAAAGSARVPVSGAAVRHAARLDALGTASTPLDDDTRRMLARLPSRLRTLGEGFDDVHARLVALETREAAEREAADLGGRVQDMQDRLRRTEDQVEDLVGPPHGEVVALGRRVAALEAQVAALGAAVARIAEALPGGAEPS